MDNDKIERAVSRLEQNLPLRANQQRLAPPLRRFHQAILEHFLCQCHAPARGDLEFDDGWDAGVAELAAQEIIVADASGKVSGAYPFVDEVRGFEVTSEFGKVQAMCAFDALAVSGMFARPMRIESRCRLSGQEIVIAQDGATIEVIEPDDRVFAAIDWDAREGARTCSASLCTEMMFIVGEESARGWSAAPDSERELFGLDEACEFISRIFVPLMR